jgi:hypothetical protein
VILGIKDDAEITAALYSSKRRNTRLPASIVEGACDRRTMLSYPSPRFLLSTIPLSVEIERGVRIYLPTPGNFHSWSWLREQGVSIE